MDHVLSLNDVCSQGDRAPDPGRGVLQELYQGESGTNAVPESIGPAPCLDVYVLGLSCRIRWSHLPTRWALTND